MERKCRPTARGYGLKGGEWLEMLQDVYRTGKDLQILNGDIVTQYTRWRKHGNPKDSTAVDLNGGSTLEGWTGSHAPIDDRKLYDTPENYEQDLRSSLRRASETGREYPIPKKLNTADAIKLLCNMKICPMNFLNLESWRPNPEPPFLDNLWSYRLFWPVHNDGICCKVIDQNPYDSVCIWGVLDPGKD